MLYLLWFLSGFIADMISLYIRREEITIGRVIYSIIISIIIGPILFLFCLFIFIIEGIDYISNSKFYNKVLIKRRK